MVSRFSIKFNTNSDGQQFWTDQWNMVLRACNPLQSKHQRHFISEMLDAEFAGFEFLGVLETGIRRIIEFLKLSQLKALSKKRCKDFAGRVIPKGTRDFNVGRRVGICAGAGFNIGSGIEIIVPQRLKVVVEHPHDRMKFNKYKFA